MVWSQCRRWVQVTLITAGSPKPLCRSGIGHARGATKEIAGEPVIRKPVTDSYHDGLRETMPAHFIAYNAIAQRGIF